MIVILCDGRIVRLSIPSNINLLTFIPGLARELLPLRENIDYIFAWDES